MGTISQIGLKLSGSYQNRTSSKPLAPEKRGQPLQEKDDDPRKIVAETNAFPWKTAGHERRGLELFDAVCQKDLEGIVAKHRLAPYVSKPQTPFKILNPDYTQKRERHDMFESFRERGERPSIPNLTPESL